MNVLLMDAEYYTKTFSSWQILVKRPNLLSGKRHKLSQITTRQFGAKTIVALGLVGNSMATGTASMDGRLIISPQLPKAVPTSFPTFVRYSGKTTPPDKMTAYVAKSLLKVT